MRNHQQAGGKLVGMYVEQSLFGAFFDIACEQNVLMTCADAQHATLVVVVRTDAVLIRMQDIELNSQFQLIPSRQRRIRAGPLVPNLSKGEMAPEGTVGMVSSGCEEAIQPTGIACKTETVPPM